MPIAVRVPSSVPIDRSVDDRRSGSRGRASSGQTVIAPFAEHDERRCGRRCAWRRTPTARCLAAVMRSGWRSERRHRLRDVDAQHDVDAARLDLLEDAAALRARQREHGEHQRRARSRRAARHVSQRLSALVRAQERRRPGSAPRPCACAARAHTSSADRHQQQQVVRGEARRMLSGSRARARAPSTRPAAAGFDRLRLDDEVAHLADRRTRPPRAAGPTSRTSPGRSG